MTRTRPPQTRQVRPCRVRLVCTARPPRCLWVSASWLTAQRPPDTATAPTSIWRAAQEHALEQHRVLLLADSRLFEVRRYRLWLRRAATAVAVAALVAAVVLLIMSGVAETVADRAGWPPPALIGGGL